MKKIVKVFEGIYNWNYFPFIGMFLVYFVVHCIIFDWHGDDVVNIESVLSRTILDDVSKMFEYSDWSSRVIINDIFGSLCYRMVNAYSIIWWCVVDSLFCVLAGYSLLKISYYLFGVNIRSFAVLIIGIFFCYPLLEMSSAGWLATTYSYLWPASIGIWFLGNYVQGSFIKKKLWFYIFNGLGLLIACNIEGGAIFFSVLFLGIILTEVISKKVNYSTVCYCIVSIGSICWHLFSPGNESRIIGETMMNFKNYNMLSFIDRLELTINRSFFYYIFNYSNLFFVFAIFLFMAVKGRCKDSFYRIVGAVPLITTFVFSIISKFGLYERLNIGTSLSNEGAITINNYNDFSSYIPTLIGIVVYLSILISFYVILEQYKHLVIAVFTFAAGFGSWMVMLFSPTIWASQTRPFSTFNFVFLALTVWLVNVVLKTQIAEEKEAQKIIWLLALCNTFNIIL